jgi:hypothetical protein
MTPVFLDEGVVLWLEPESEEEEEFLRSCPEDWTWEQVKSEWDARSD